MNDSMIVTLTVGQLSTLISDIVRKEIKDTIPPPPIKFLNAKEVASILRCSQPTLRTHIKKGILKKHKFGRKVLYKQNEVEELAIHIRSYQRK